MLNRFIPGQALSVRGPNEIVDQANRILAHGTPQEGEFGTIGTTFHQREAPEHQWFQLYADFVYPDIDGAATGRLDREPTPWAYAYPIWCHQHATSDTDIDGNEVRSYKTTANQQVVKIYDPAAVRNSDGYAVGLSTLTAGDCVPCRLNRQSGRWEVTGSVLRVTFFELAEDKGRTDIWAWAYPVLWTKADASVTPLADDSYKFKVYDPLAYFSGLGRVGETAGARGIAISMGGTWVIFQPCVYI